MDWRIFLFEFLFNWSVKYNDMLFGLNKKAWQVDFHFCFFIIFVLMLTLNHNFLRISKRRADKPVPFSNSKPLFMLIVIVYENFIT